MCHVIDSMLYPPENTLVQFSLYPLKVKNIDISQALSIGGYKRWHTLVSFILCRNIDTVQGFNSGVFLWRQYVVSVPGDSLTSRTKLWIMDIHTRNISGNEHTFCCVQIERKYCYIDCAVLLRTQPSVGHSRYSTWSVEIPLLLYLFVELYIPYNGDCVMFSFLVKAITTWSRVLIFTHTGSFTKLTEWFILVWIFY